MITADNFNPVAYRLQYEKEFLAFLLGLQVGDVIDGRHRFRSLLQPHKNKNLLKNFRNVLNRVATDSYNPKDHNRVRSKDIAMISDMFANDGLRYKTMYFIANMKIISSGRITELPEYIEDNVQKGS